jgi:hypothetical protein
MGPQSIRTGLRISFMVSAIAVLLGAGSAAASDQSATGHFVRSTHHRYPAHGIYNYARGYGPAPFRFGYGPGYTTNHDAWLSSGYW